MLLSKYLGREVLDEAQANVQWCEQPYVRTPRRAKRRTRARIPFVFAVLTVIVVLTVLLLRLVPCER